MRGTRRASSMGGIVQMLCAGLLVGAMAIPAHAATLTRSWVERYVGGTDFQYASSLAISPDGRTAYVTGISAGPNHEGDPYDAFATVAYDTATGATRWIARYSDADVDNWASNVVVTPDGQRLFVTGATPNGYPIVAYDAATGTRLWVRHAAGPDYVGSQGRLAVSPDGRRVYFTGETTIGDGPETEMLTIAFRTTTGSTVWSSMLVDPSGQVRPEAIKRRSTGTASIHHWRHRELNQFPSPTPPDFITVAYGTDSGAELWVTRYDGTGQGCDEAFAVSVTPNGRRVIVVAGTSDGTSGLPQYAVIAYRAASGATVWATRDGGPTLRRSVAAMAMDRFGRRVFVTGSESSSDWSANRYRTVSFSVSSGAKLWSKALNGDTVATVHAIAMSADGAYVFATGSMDTVGAPHSQGYATVAYRAGTGQRVASARYLGPNGYAEAEAIGVSSSGGIFVTGRAGGPSPRSPTDSVEGAVRSSYDGVSMANLIAPETRNTSDISELTEPAPKRTQPASVTGGSDAMSGPLRHTAVVLSITAPL